MSIEEIRELVLKSNHRKSSSPLITNLFKKWDSNFSNQIEYYEFKAGLDYLVAKKLKNEDIEKLFLTFDKDKTGTIDFTEFVLALRPPLPQSRLNVINEAFERLDVNRDGVLSVEDFRKIYIDQAKSHPKYLSKEWDIDQVLRSFLDAFDTPGDCDGFVTKEEFLNYYSVVSATITDDSYFDLLMRKSFNLTTK